MKGTKLLSLVINCKFYIREYQLGEYSAVWGNNSCMQYKSAVKTKISCFYGKSQENQLIDDAVQEINAIRYSAEYNCRQIGQSF